MTQPLPTERDNPGPDALDSTNSDPDSLDPAVDHPPFSGDQDSDTSSHDDEG